MRIAITGASGFLGKQVLRALRARNHEAVAIVRRADSISPDLEKRVAPDLARSDLEPLIEGVDAVVQCAARVHITKSAAQEINDEINRDLPIRLAQAARNVGVKRFVQLSSVVAVTSLTEPGGTVSDNSTPCPQTNFGRAKLAADIALAEQSSPTMPIVSLRPPIMLGPGVGAHVALLMRCARAGLPLPIGAIGNRRSVSFVENIADAIVAACETRVEGAYIVTDSAPLSTADLYRKLLRANGHADRVFRVPRGMVSLAARTILGARADSLLGDAAFDGTRFAQATGWQPRVTLDEAIRRTVALSGQRSAS